jgi:anti-sigma factor RsiW
MHELLVPYALDALDEDEAHEVERHLAACEPCRLELCSLQEAATELAYPVVGPAPPSDLFGRIEAGLRPPVVVPLRLSRIAGVAAVVAAAATVALAFWATSLSRSLGEERQARADEARLVSVLSSPGARRVPIAGRGGTLVVTPGRDAALIVDDLPHAGRGLIYEAWVVADGEARPSGLFAGGPEGSAFALDRPVPAGARVAVTLQERDDVERMRPPVLFGAQA